MFVVFWIVFLTCALKVQNAIVMNFVPFLLLQQSCLSKLLSLEVILQSFLQNFLDTPEIIDIL